MERQCCRIMVHSGVLRSSGRNRRNKPTFHCRLTDWSHRYLCHLLRVQSSFRMFRWVRRHLFSKRPSCIGAFGVRGPSASCIACHLWKDATEPRLGKHGFQLGHYYRLNGRCTWGHHMRAIVKSPSKCRSQCLKLKGHAAEQGDSCFGLKLE